MNKLYTLLHSIINTLNRVVRDKVDTSQLNTEVNSALSTAKESGQFDGAPGKDGADGKDGAPGRDGTDGVGITTTTIDGDGQLVIHYSNGTTETLGVVVGADGKNGVDGTNGTDGTDGTDGIGIAKTEIDAEGKLVITYTDNTTSNLGVVVGADGSNGQNGTDGQDGADGKDGVGITRAEINTDGELVLSFSDGTAINVGRVVGGQASGETNGTEGTPGKDGVGIEDVTISAEGNLTVKLTNGTILNLGNIKGADGIGISKTEINEAGELVITDTNGQSTNLGKVVGSDGKDGADGKDGIDGAPGKDGVSVTHEWDGTTLKVTSASGTTSTDLKGEPGTSGVHFGSDEPKDDSYKVWIDLSGQGDVLDYVPSPDTASVGQILAVKTVDENGKPTEWEAVGFPSGGESGGIEKIIDFTTTEPTMEFQIPIDTEEMANKLLNASELHLYLYIPRDAEDTETTTTGNVSVGVVSQGDYHAEFAKFEGVIVPPTVTYKTYSKSLAKIFIEPSDSSVERLSIGIQSKKIANDTSNTSSLYRTIVDTRGFKNGGYIFVNGTQNMATGTRFVLGVRV